MKWQIMGIHLYFVFYINFIKIAFKINNNIEGPGANPVYVEFWAVFMFAQICLIFGM